MKKIFLLVALAIVVIVVGLMTYRTTREESSSEDQTLQQTELSQLPEENSLVEASPIGDENMLRAGGSSYLDPQGVFSFLYPNDYTLDTSDAKHIRIYKRGETQRPQSEMSDGVLIVFESLDLGGKSLESFVDTRIQQSTVDGTSDLTQPKRATTVNKYSGFTYEIQGFGNSINIYLQKNAQSSSALAITYSVSDLQQKGYQAEVESVLSTVELIK